MRTPSCLSVLAGPILLLSVGILLFSPSPAVAQAPADSAAIRDAALDYIDGYYTADAERMKRALHPALKKRMVFTRPSTRADSLNRQDAQVLVATTRSREPTPPSERRAEVTVLDVYKDAASVRIHRSTIVNLDRVRALTTNAHGAYYVCLEDGPRLKLSRSYRDAFETAIGTHF